MIIVIIVILTGFIWTYFHCTPFSSCPWSKVPESAGDKKVTLTFYGARDTEDDWSEVIDRFQEYELQQRGVKVYIEYKQLDQYNYEDLIYDSLVNKKGPNIFMMFNSWLPKYRARIEPMPSTIMTMDQFEENFVPVTRGDLTEGGKIYSLPLYVDTPALLYNKTMFYNAGIVRPPENWNEFVDDVEILTQLDNNGKIIRRGAALGGSKYTNRAQDIVMLLVMQNNTFSDDARGNLVSFQTDEAMRAVKLYTGFADKANRYYTWDYSSQIYSIDAFIEGRAAMSINYSYELDNVDSKTQGALDYGVATVPQKYKDNKVNYANYWSPVVAKGATCIKEKGITATCAELSWDFISFAAQPDNARLYLQETNRPAAQVSIIEEQMGEVGSKLAPFAEQALTAKSWENANNKKTDEVLVDMIESIITTDKTSKKTVEKAMSLAVDKVKELE